MKSLLLFGLAFPAALVTGDTDAVTTTTKGAPEAAAAATIVAEPVAPAAISDETVGTISGRVVWEGDRPEPLPKLKIGDKESEGCVHGGSHVDMTDRSLLIGEKGGIANVVLSVKVKGMDVKVPAEPVIVDQSGCRFEPHVQIVTEGTTVRFKNSDGINHNVHTYSIKNKALNNNIAGGSHEDQKLEKGEDITITCDIHPWMKSYVIVTDEPVHAITRPDGSFSLKGLPAGTYKVSYWHETLGKGKTEEVTVEPGADSKLEVKLSAEKKGGGSKGRGRRGR